MAHDLLYTNESEWYAQDLRALHDYFNEGVLDDSFEVTAGGTGLSIDVDSGTGFVQGDTVVDQGMYRVLLENAQNSESFWNGGLDTADATDPRIDRIVARVYDDEVDSSGETGFHMEVLTGTPTAGADLTNLDGAAALPDSALLLAYVLVEAGDTAVDPANIQDERADAMPAGGGGGGTPLTVRDELGPTTVTPVDDLTFSGAEVIDMGGGAAMVAIQGELGVYLTSKGDLISRGAANPGTLAVGTDGHVLTADSTMSLGLKWAAAPGGGSGIPTTIVDAKGDLVGATAADTPARVPTGTVDGQVLTRSAAAATGVAWATPDVTQTELDAANSAVTAAQGDADAAQATADAAIPKGLVDAKGDLLTATADNTPARLAPGTDGHVLTLDSGEATGIKWAAAPGGAGGIPATIGDAKGDLIGFSAADTAARIAAAGSDGLVLKSLASAGQGVEWASPLPSRTDGIETTGSLADDATENLTFDLAKSFRILQVETDVAARVRLYATPGDRTADAARPIGTDPTGDHGVILDHVTTPGDLEWRMSPTVDGSSMEATPVAGIAAAITNLSGATDTVQVTLTYVPTES
jgi:hypothetical protein